MNDAKLEKLIKPLIKIYDNLELELIKDIAIRLNTYDGVKGSLKWYLDKLRDMGGFHYDNLELLAEYAGKSQKEVKEILKYAGYDTSKFDKYKEVLDDEILLNNPSSIFESYTIQNIINTTLKETNSMMELIQTKALESAEESYMKILTDSYMKVSSGIYSYDTAIRQGLKEMAKKGFTGATYSNGKQLSLEATVRRDVLTKCHQLSAEIEIEKARNVLKSNLVYVTQHLGARIRTKYTKEDYEVHADWQGKVYMLDGSNDKYDNFYDKTGYGELLGLCGVNCRHHVFATKEGWSHSDLIDKEENEKAYLKQQEQRKYERRIRQYKREEVIAQQLGDSEELKNINNEYAIFNKKYEKFLKDNSLRRDYTREYIEKGLVKVEDKNWFDKLSKQEQMDLKEYISSGSYKINEPLYNHRNLSEEQIQFRDSLDSALKKAPKYVGYVNRSVEINSQEQLNHILNIFDNNTRTGNWGSYISSSKQIYDETMKLQIKIKSQNGRDLSSLNDEGGGEILFERNTKFKLVDYKSQNGKIYVDLEEVK